MFHVAADNRFPYWLYGGQQESGSAGVPSRSEYGTITFRDWHTVGVEEYGYAAPDPLHPGIIYGGKVTRFDERTGDVQNVGPVVVRDGKDRFVRTAPVLFSTADPHVLFFATQFLYETIDGGRSWRAISPDLSRPDPGVPSSLGIYAADAAKAEHRGVIYAIGPSPLNVNVIWTGSDDGAVHVTRDRGLHWSDVTPKELTPWSKVTQIDASHFDANRAYLSASRFRVDDVTPLLFRTRDGGATWTAITHGLGDSGPANVIREDPRTRGLLFAGTERGVYVSFNDGDEWEPLTLNLPRTSVRDLIVHRDDIAIATHGRGFWILDNMTPLRRLARGRGDSASLSRSTILYPPPVVYRLRRDQTTDTPLPPEVPAAKNPPDGATIDYYLPDDAHGPVTLEIFRGSAGTAGARTLVRRYSSDDKPAPYDDKTFNVPMYWARPIVTLPSTKGAHRFVWDLRYPAPGAVSRDFPISAVYRDTPLEPLGVLAVPGVYSVTLTVNGETKTAPLTLKMDPRATITAAGLQQQFALASRISRMLDRSFAEIGRLKPAGGPSPAPDSQSAAASRLAELEALNTDLATAYDVVEGADRAPTTQAVQAVAALERRVRKAVP
jgi:photosystem II stability/assembly factor-like uncharacterized protein